jgi:hypothetical protein
MNLSRKSESSFGDSTVSSIFNMMRIQFVGSHTPTPWNVYSEIAGVAHRVVFHVVMDNHIRNLKVNVRWFHAQNASGKDGSVELALEHYAFEFPLDSKDLIYDSICIRWVHGFYTPNLNCRSFLLTSSVGLDSYGLKCHGSCNLQHKLYFNHETSKSRRWC